jgi:hypothetical protein
MASSPERTYVVRSGSSATNTTAVSLTAATAKSVIAVLGGASDTLGLRRVKVSFPSVTATDAPATVELGIITALATVEPTYTRIVDSVYVPVQQGLVEWWYPLGDELQADPSQGFALRVTSPSATSCLASLLYSE